MKLLSFSLSRTLLALSLIMAQCSAARFKVESAGDEVNMVKYYRNWALGTSSSRFKHAIIVIHGTNRNADDYYDRVMSALSEERKQDTLVFAPLFQIDTDNPNSDELYWTSGGWKKGNRSVNSASRESTSFHVVDDMVLSISMRFPKVRKIFIAGHSAGGQFVQRYAGLGTGPDSSHIRSNIEIRYVVANPSSYMFLNNVRPRSTREYWNQECPSSYNSYKYGMSYLRRLGYYKDNYSGLSEVRDNLVSRDIFLLLGSNDVGSQYLDDSCEAYSQGPNRFERGLNYFSNVKNYDDNANTYLYEVKGVGHSSAAMFLYYFGKESWTYF